MIIPSIDLMDGKAVKLVQGNPNNKQFEKDALELAKEFSIYPQINLIDLDAAFGTGDNLNLIKQICKICNCNVGGGIRTIAKAYEILKLGANKIIIGTCATKEFLCKLPKEKIIVAIDSKKGKVVDKGWTNTTNITAAEQVMTLQQYCYGFLYTYVDKEGTMDSIDIDTVLRLKDITNNKLQYAGGVSNKDQIIELAKYDVDTIIGMAYYEKKIDINQTIIELIDFEKNRRLVPTIVKDESSQILMMAFSNKESVLKTLQTRKGNYYSRTRNELWQKGLTSGNTQDLIRVKIDCDNDTLIYTVKQKNVACHKNTYSCFGDEKFNFDKLLSIIKSKINTDSFSGKLLKNELEIKDKILEEAKEVVNYKDTNNLKWEIADLIYFITLLMIKNKINFKDIENELKVRNYMKKYIKSTKIVNNEAIIR
jgi:phosphoribosyl-AMP cyclohydrolase / phosphoribosyl-ATP pyrophosphohydrolase